MPFLRSKSKEPKKQSGQSPSTSSTRTSFTPSRTSSPHPQPSHLPPPNPALEAVLDKLEGLCLDWRNQHACYKPPSTLQSPSKRTAGIPNLAAKQHQLLQELDQTALKLCVQGYSAEKVTALVARCGKHLLIAGERAERALLENWALPTGSPAQRLEQLKGFRRNLAAAKIVAYLCSAVELELSGPEEAAEHLVLRLSNATPVRLHAVAVEKVAVGGTYAIVRLAETDAEVFRAGVGAWEREMIILPSSTPTTDSHRNVEQGDDRSDESIVVMMTKSAIIALLCERLGLSPTAELARTKLEEWQRDQGKETIDAIARKLLQGFLPVEYADGEFWPGGLRG